MFRFGKVCLLCCLFANASFGKEEIPANIVAGKQVETDAKLTVGTKLVGIWDKKNYLVEVLELKRNKEIRIHWIGFDKSEDVDVLPNTLYYIADTTQTRKSKASVLPKEYQTIDKNGDGQIGLYEWERSKFAEFKRLDKNKDGFLTPQELVSKVVPVAAATTSATPAATEGTPAAEPLPNPGNMEGYSEMIGQSFTFSVTGSAEGTVVGTSIFSTSSDLAAVAVHAGILKPGQTGNVTASIAASPPEFKGTTANGVKSLDGSSYTAAFSVK